MDPSLTSGAALVVIVATICGVAVGRYPVVRMNRASIALLGAACLVGIGAIDLDQAYSFLDLDTLVLLLAMMILNANLRLAGFFGWAVSSCIGGTTSPFLLLAALMGAAGLLSALFLNDTIVLMLAPLVLELARAQRRDPLPFLLGLALAANIGSVATITGNPQNMLIGVSSQIPYLRFTARLAPVAVAGLVVAWGVVALVHRSSLAAAPTSARIRPSTPVHRPLLVKSLAATAVMLVAFLAGAPVPAAALVCASLLLVTRRLRPERVFEEVDWSLLVFFAGLFVVTGALGGTGPASSLMDRMQAVVADGPATLTVVAAVLSNLVSNVPAVMLLGAWIPAFPDVEQAWLVLAMASTLAGNLTLLGSVANLIVAEIARRQGVAVGFGAYVRVGLPVTLITLAVGWLWLTFVR